MHWRCLLQVDGQNKLQHIHTREYYSVTEKNVLSCHSKTWMNLKCIIPSERSQSGKATSCRIPFIWQHCREYKLINDYQEAGRRGR